MARTQMEVQAQISLQLANNMIQILTASLSAREVENDELKEKLASLTTPDAANKPEG